VVVVELTGWAGHGPRRGRQPRTSLAPADGNTNFPGARPPRGRGTTTGRVVPQVVSAQVMKVHAPQQAWCGSQRGLPSRQRARTVRMGGGAERSGGSSPSPVQPMRTSSHEPPNVITPEQSAPADPAAASVTPRSRVAERAAMTSSSRLEAVARTRSRGNSEIRSANVVAWVRVPGGGWIANAARVVRVAGAHFPAAPR